MKKKFRLLKNEDFKEVIKYKLSVANQEFIIYGKKNKLKHTRIGVSVGVKIGKAVTRNKIKRQIRSMLNSFLNFSENIDYVIIVRKDYLEKKFNENLISLEKIFNKMKSKVMNCEKKN